MTTHIHYPSFHVPAVVRRHLLLLSLLLVVVIAATIVGIQLSQRTSTGVEAVNADWSPEYGVDTPLVTYANLGAALWVGADANLDPDVARWGQSEYYEDTSLVTYAEPGAAIWVGADANLDPDE